MPPWLGLALLLALTLATLYQVATGKYGWRVVVYWIFIALGLLGGEALAEAQGWTLGRVGDLRLATDLAGGFLVTGALWLLRL